MYSLSPNFKNQPQPRSPNPQTPNLHPQPSTLNPLSSTLNPQPSTLNPQPLTLNPQPSTLNPHPSTLNPKFQTLTLDPGSWILNPAFFRWTLQSRWKSKRPIPICSCSEAGSYLRLIDSGIAYSQVIVFPTYLSAYLAQPPTLTQHQAGGQMTRRGQGGGVKKNPKWSGRKLAIYSIAMAINANAG